MEFSISLSEFIHEEETKMRTAKFSKQFTLSLNSDTYQRIKEQADREKLSTAEVLRDIIDRGMEALEMEEGNNE
ncbi:MAG: hypothetical protein C4576_13815 [Desulfobacteraceae bacterium]|nr:MAG: hypothetical protein C4576_13815 [Desulfobacteraceae bacterium]